MRSIIATMAILLLSATPSHAERKRLLGAEISAALNGRAVESTGTPSWRQTFEADGSTLYTSDRGADQGRWQVRGDQYCSQWPPSESWSCYDLAVDGELIIFVGASGTEHPAHFVPN
jgi:hypothetical protein